MKKVLPLILLILALVFTSCTMKKSEKLYPVLKYTDKDASYVFINKDNEVKIDKHFEDVLKAFEDDYAVVIENGKVAIINREGEDVLSGIENVYQIKDGLVTVKNKDKTELIDLKTKEVLLKYDYILIGENKVLSYLEGDKWGYRTLDGEKTLAAQFEEAYPFGKKSGVAVKDGKVVIVDGDMNVKETNYAESYKINDETILAREGDKQLLLDLNGDVVNPGVKGDLTEVYGGMYTVFDRKNGELVKKVYTLKGEPVSDEVFTDVRLLGNGFFAANNGELFALYSEKEGRVTDYKYDFLSAESFDVNGGFVTGVSKGVGELLDKSGNIKKTIGKNIESFMKDENLFITSDYGKITYFDLDGNAIEKSPKISPLGNVKVLIDEKDGKNYLFIVSKDTNEKLNASLKSIADRITTEKNVTYDYRLEGDILYATLKTHDKSYPFMVDIYTGEVVDAKDIFIDEAAIETLVNQKKTEENMQGDVELVCFSFDSDLKMVLRSDKEYFVDIPREEIENYLDLTGGEFFKSLLAPKINK